MNRILKLVIAGFCGLQMMTAANAQAIRTDGPHFKDEQGRTLMLRGVNLAGSSKIPFKPVADPRLVSFIGRPFPLSEADQHFRRLQAWGLTAERLIVTWEAIEHAGPGKYDRAYLDYIHEVIRRAQKYGISVYIDFHQDSFSRGLGGDGAPYWAFQAVGLTTDKSAEPGAPQTYDYGLPGYWPPSAGRHAVATMDTLFWAGNDFAPGLKVGGQPIQEFLQSHYLKSVEQVATRLKDLPNVIGYDLYNEPQVGYIGTNNLSQPDPIMYLVGNFAAPGAKRPSFWEYIQATSGFAPGNGSVIKVNSLWAPGAKDVWRQFGVWDVVDGKPKLLKPDYFAKVNGVRPNYNSYLKAFTDKFVRTVRGVVPSALIFQELNVMGGDGRTTGMALNVPGVVNEPHFYDVGILLSKKYTPDVAVDFFGKKHIGRDAILAYYGKALNDYLAESKPLGNVPTVLGEVGMSFSMNDGEAYRTGDFTAQKAHARLLFDALDRSMMSYSIWNYTPDNTNLRGDNWNGEDLSIFSLSQRKNPSDINSGGRALNQIVRPYPMATAGTPVSIVFDPDTRVLEYKFKADANVRAPTEIFLPKVQYPAGVSVTASSGSYRADMAKSMLYILDATGDVTVVVKPN